MSIINHPMPSNGQPVMSAKGSATQDACQHLAMAQFPQEARFMKPFQSNSSKNNLLVIAGRDTDQREPVSTISYLNPNKELFQNGAFDGLKMPVADQSFLCSLSDNKQFVWIDDAMGSLDRYVASKPYVVLSVAVSSAVKLDSKQIELIARKMQKLTGFNNLKLENTVDPSLIAGFTISYSDDESNVIDLSVKGQLAALAARAESSEQRWSSHTA